MCLSGVLLTINTVQTGSIITGSTDYRRNCMEIQLLLDVITAAVKNSE